MTEQVASPSPRGTLKKKLSAGQFIVAPGILRNDLGQSG